MRILIFTEGTIIMHKDAVGHTREEIVKQAKEKIKNWILGTIFRKKGNLFYYKSYVPVGNAAKKLRNWKKDGAEILYLTSRRIPEQITQIRKVLKKYDFSDGLLLFRQKGEGYKDVAERAVPDILVEDDCESIGGIYYMAIAHVKSETKNKIKSIRIKEFGGIDHLPDKISAL